MRPLAVLTKYMKIGDGTMKCEVVKDSVDKTADATGMDDMWAIVDCTGTKNSGREADIPADLALATSVMITDINAALKSSWVETAICDDTATISAAQDQMIPMDWTALSMERSIGSKVPLYLVCHDTARGREGGPVEVAPLSVILLLILA